MSNIAKSVSKVFKKIKENPLKAVVTVAAVWWGVGTAMNYFAAPQAGLSAAASSQASSMWTATTEFFGASAQTDGATQAVNTAESLVSPTAEAIPLGSETAGAGTAIPADVSAQHAAGLAAEQSALDLGTANLPLGHPLAPGTAAPAAETGMFSWMKQNPMATMMLGQAGAGAYQGYLEDRQMEREDRRLREQGLFGFDRRGEPGVIRSRMPAQQNVDTATEDPAASTPPSVTAPNVGAPGVTAQGVARPSVPIARRMLPTLDQQGQLARG